MRHIILFFILSSIAFANPKYLALRLSPEGIVEGYHGYSEETPPEGMILIPWVDMGRQDLAPLPNKRMQTRQYRVHLGRLERRSDVDVLAEDLSIRKEEAKQSLLALKKQRRELAEDVKDGDATQADLAKVDAEIAAKRNEIQEMR
jgi:hypothetical protein